MKRLLPVLLMTRTVLAKLSADYLDQRYERMDLAYDAEDWEPTLAAKALLAGAIVRLPTGNCEPHRLPVILATAARRAGAAP